MDYLKTVFGIQDSNKSPLKFDQQKTPTEVTTNVESNKQKTDITKQDNTKQDTNVNNSSTRLEPTTASERLELFGNDIREAVKKVIPLDDDDCLSCKVIGTSVFWGSSLFILRSGQKFRQSQIGFRRVTASLTYTSFAFGLFMLGTARLLDLNIFQKGNDKNIFKLAQEDLQSVMDFFRDSTDGKK